MIKNHLKYGTLLSLYLAQSIPMSFFTTVVPVIMRQEEYSLTSIGLIQLIRIPWVLKFLWAPLIDNTSTAQAHYRRWIIGSELFYAATIIAIGFFSLSTDFSTIVFLVIIAIFASGTQDIATDAFAIISLKKKDRSVGNSMQSGGSFLGTLIGSGVLLMAYYYLGWQTVLLLLALLVTAALIPLYFIKADFTSLPRTGTKTSWHVWAGYFKLPGTGRHLLMLITFYSGIVGLMWMLKPFLVDLNYNEKEIGFIAGVFGPATGTLTSLGAGFLMRKIRKSSMMQIIAIAGVITALFFRFNMAGEPPTWIIYAGSGLLWGTYGMAMVFIYTIAMNKVRNGLEGTDFTVQIVITHLSNLLIIVPFGKLANEYGYTGLMNTQVFFTFLVLIFSFTLFKKNVEKDLISHQ